MTDLPTNDRSLPQYGQAHDQVSGLTWPAIELHDVTAEGLASDTVDISYGPCRGIYVGGAGNIKLIDAFGNAAVTFVGLTACSVLPVRARRIFTTPSGTTATGLVLLY
jgi:hypothetical protein